MVKTLQERVNNGSSNAIVRLFQQPGFMNAERERMTEETAEKLLKEREDMSKWVKENPNAGPCDHPSCPPDLRKKYLANNPGKKYM